MRFEEASSAVIDALEERTEADLAGAETLETAAQRFCEILQETFAESTVLARLFTTVPYGALPTGARAFVQSLVGPRTDYLKPKTPVLTLLGTRGVLPRWNSRHLSEGHVGIPLASAEFVDAIPMIASLLKQLGVAIANAEDVETTIVTQALGKAAGVFFVDDAQTAVDSQGRSIITARDFVQEHGVRTVFGFGGAYAITGTFMVTILFTRESMGRAQAQRFMRLANRFKAATMRPVGRGQIFA
jgi:hypothetical protein